jgi:hypothetical protein
MILQSPTRECNYENYVDQTGLSLTKFIINISINVCVSLIKFICVSVIKFIMRIYSITNLIMFIPHREC